MRAKLVSAPHPASSYFEKKYGWLLKEKEVAEILHVTPRTLQDRRTERWQETHPPEECGPPYVYVGSGQRGAVRYPSVWLMEWMEQRRHPRLKTEG